ncbi:NDP-hexose 2,3-dehydratase family protein [Parafrankia sp. EUN1f]|uniref:NDP-hexose 2,3-dehydratase family protein n=1 Tax=Parafrankia sp. EUN1f TaxID=102897 RepID=UPI0001C438EF|nr:NDP-hexose 2,3-dehydratase family protein [Parafrankia sp. EUN1f]EFC86873.1 NDP-hexose 23-dehydratase [Parafrankia sp. EUN1f]
MSRILRTPAEFTAEDHKIALRIAESALTVDGVERLTDIRAWFTARASLDIARVNRIPFAEMDRWGTDPRTGDLRHDSGRFFSIEGLAVEVPQGPVPRWTQPIVNQPEIGILGFLVQEFNGVLHFLVQAKNEPGNATGVQLSPTVQATRSNYTGVHGGAKVPYLGYFRDPDRHRIIADVLQSEQGSWFYQKRNRNIVIEVDEEIPLLDGFRWLTLGQLHRFLAEDDVVNMDARTVLSCLPFSAEDLTGALPSAGEGLPAAVLRSASPEQGARHTTAEILRWVTDARTSNEVRTRRMPLRDIDGWTRTADAIEHDDRLFFRVIAVRVETGHREVTGWTQPMIEPIGVGVIAFVVTRFDGVLHALVQARVEPGYLDVVELAPTAQWTPSNYTRLPAAAAPRFAGEILTARPEQVLFEATLSEEGGRFHRALNRYTIIELDPARGAALDTGPAHRWLALHQLVDLLRHSHYVNVQGRSLVACLHTLSGARDRP